MQFVSGALTFFDTTPEYLSLKKVWALDESELSKFGQDLVLRIESDEFVDKSLRRAVSWNSQAILEFQDLQAVTFPQSGRFFNINYLFFEGLSVLRESIVSGLNGLMHASFAVLRSALELFTFHFWWKERLRFASNYDDFYTWLEGKKRSAPFTNAVASLFSSTCLTPISPKEDEVMALYSQLCSYAHKPLITEAITTLRGGNIQAVTDDMILYWFTLLFKVQTTILDLAIRSDPQSLFPVSLYRKFGFNPPVGVFFDQQNFLCLNAAIGDEGVKLYRQYYKNADPPKSQLDWFERLRELTDDEVLATWSETQPLTDWDESFERRVVIGYALIKAKIRALITAFAYNLSPPAIENFNIQHNKPAQ